MKLKAWGVGDAERSAVDVECEWFFVPEEGTMRNLRRRLIHSVVTISIAGVGAISGIAIGASPAHASVDTTVAIAVPSNANASQPAISADGRFVAFETAATNFPGSDFTNPNIYVRDRQAGTTTNLTNNHGFTTAGANIVNSRVTISADHGATRRIRFDRQRRHHHELRLQLRRWKRQRHRRRAIGQPPVDNSRNLHGDSPRHRQRWCNEPTPADHHDYRPTDHFRER